MKRPIAFSDFLKDQNSYKSSERFVAYDGKRIINIDNGDSKSFANKTEMEKTLSDNQDIFSSFFFDKDYLESHLSGGNLPEFKVTSVTLKITSGASQTNLKPLSEDTDYSLQGFWSAGHVISVSVEKSKNNSLMQMNVKGSKTLQGLKSFENISPENEDKYIKISKQHSLLLEKEIEKFELKINDIVISFSKEVEEL